MKFESHWQPLRNEDAQTALVFGFLRHAPTSLALDVWLSDLLKRPATGSPLEVTSFWPRYPAGQDGGVFTEPDVVIDADDGQPLLVIVECKPLYGQHTPEQLAREAVDAARHLEPERVAVVLVAADPGAPADLPAWEQQARADLAADGMAAIQVDFLYSSWARLARAVEHAARTDAAWRAYAHDVLTRLRVHGALDYEGAPMLDDLDGLTLRNAVEAYHRIMRAYRQLALAVHHHPVIAELALEPFAGGHAMLRDGRSHGLPGEPGYFETTVLITPYWRPGWPNSCGVFFAAWLTGEDGPHLEVGAFTLNAGRGELPWQFAWADSADELNSAELESVIGATLDTRAAARHAEFVYAERRWRPEDGDGDVEWIAQGMRAAAKAWPAADQHLGKDLPKPDLDLGSPAYNDNDDPERPPSDHQKRRSQGQPPQDAPQ